MESGGEGPLCSRTVRTIVYIEEEEAGRRLGYEATMEITRGGLDALMLRPLRNPEADWPVAAGSATWRLAEAFLMVLPSLRCRAALHSASEVA